jgi:hypothetical protein
MLESHRKVLRLFYRNTRGFQKGVRDIYETIIGNIATYSKPTLLGKARLVRPGPKFSFFV